MNIRVEDIKSAANTVAKNTKIQFKVSDWLPHLVILQKGMASQVGAHAVIQCTYLACVI
jgi:hypothetical protein